MERFHATEEGNIKFTAEEEAEADQREANWTAYSAQREKDAFNAGVLELLAALDLRRIRPLAEGDAAYLADLNAQVIALRAQLVK